MMNFMFRSTLMKRLLFCAVLFFVAIDDAYAGASIVNIKTYVFNPASITAAVGDTVTWVNQDDDPHTVKSSGPEGAFKSPALDTNEKYSFTFTKPGVYKYFCTLHPHMQGEIVVR